MHFRKRITSLVSLLLVFSFIFVITGTSAFTSSAQTNISDLQSELTDLQKKQNDIKKQISSLKKNIENSEALKEVYQQRILNSQAEIDNYNSQIVIIDGEIAQIQQDIADAEVKIAENKEKFKQRLRAMYMTGDTSMLGILVSADNFSDYLYKSELLRCVSKQDTALLQELQDQVKAINEHKTSLENRKSTLGSLSQSLTTKKAELEKEITELDTLISDLNSQKDQLQNQYNENSGDLQKLESAIAEATKNTNGLVYSGSQFLWPVPGYYKISSYYRTPSRPNHTGIDISSSGIYGKNIVAATDGIVTLSQYYYGYGNCVMINHGTLDGKTYVTVYGHASELCVSKGQYVTAGTVIARVGSTGNSSGPHLHFEIRVNNSATNPMNYFSK